ncbi:uncharacterized protein [Spinacia oleracea]|uniref:DUF4218 domain-containing protein n=1 Tax=Spinacia oleracea TaxID=3562 RepID=A0ABM3QYD5_SPIOL|nr:uncharacterized protein LOC130463300 [Spinacia oleracea]
MWYLPVVPRLKRLFANAKDAEKLTWHADGRNKDGILRHAADSPQWKHIDTTFPNFSRETRNLRLGLCTDEINPFGNMSSQHSTWPVLLVNYNLPPWLCMKRKYIMLSILISGPKQPGNDIDVYLAPLIEDLKKLWDKRERVYDEYRKETFTLRAMIFCTINDFPAYGNLSGHVVKKVVYPFQRVFLPRNHPYRRIRKAFNGEPEHRSPPKPLTGKQVYERVKDINCVFGKPYKSLGDKLCYKKRSAFWILPYWEHLSVRHCIDVMHVEKNVFDSLIGTLLNMPGKTKDGEKARNDMVKMGIRLELKPTKKGKRYYLPPACYTLSKKEKKVLCESLHNVKVPSGYSSNIRNLVSLKDLKLVGLKSHDCHTLMQEILPIAIRSILPKQVRQAIIRLCLFFKAICSRVLDPGKLDSLQSQLIVTLCQLEMYFPPSFFDIMVHLVREVKLCGPVYLRYIYPFERNMGDLKGYVRNRSRPKGSIVEGYLTDEVLRYYIEHLEEFETLGLPKPRHNKERVQGIGTVGRKVLNLSREIVDQAYLYILQQVDEVQPYLADHMNLIRQEYHGRGENFLRDEHNPSFIRWFQEKVDRYLKQTPNDVSEDITWLAFGPDANVVSYEGYDINGYCFNTKRRDASSTTQNSGVSLVASTLHFSSAKDNNPQHAKMNYYGMIEDIFELDFVQFRVPVFKCNLVDIGKGVNIDDMGYTVVNFNKPGHCDEPFIMASQAKQVFYMIDPADTSKSVVIQGKKHGVAVADLVPNEDEYDQVDEIPVFSMLQNTPVQVDDSTDHHLRGDHNEGVWWCLLLCLGDLIGCKAPLLFLFGAVDVLIHARTGNKRERFVGMASENDNGSPANNENPKKSSQKTTRGPSTPKYIIEKDDGPFPLQLNENNILCDRRVQE